MNDRKILKFPHCKILFKLATLTWTLSERRLPLSRSQTDTSTITRLNDKIPKARFAYKKSKGHVTRGDQKIDGHLGLAITKTSFSFSVYLCECVSSNFWPLPKKAFFSWLTNVRFLQKVNKKNLVALVAILPTN